MRLTVLDPPPKRTLQCELRQGYYRPGDAGAVTIALAGSGSSAAEGPTTELLLIEMFWRPNPGVTFSDPAATNAKITYVVDLAGSVMVFQGAGFVRIWENRARAALSGQVYSSDLRLLSSVGVAEPRMRSVAITGRFDAVNNPPQTIKQILRVEKYLRHGGSQSE